jgi:hypothetical protein
MQHGSSSTGLSRFALTVPDLLRIVVSRSPALPNTHRASARPIKPQEGFVRPDFNRRAAALSDAFRVAGKL